MKEWGRIGSTLCLVLLVATLAHADAKTVRSRGFKYILHHQNEDGSYGQGEAFRVGKTALVLYALASGERAYRMQHGPFVSNAVAYVRKQKNDDGSYGATDPLWETWLVAKAFAALETPALTEEATAAAAWLKAQRTKTGREDTDPSASPDVRLKTAAALAQTLGQMTLATHAADTASALDADVAPDQGHEDNAMALLLPGTFDGNSVYALLWGVQSGIDNSIHGAAWLDSVVAALEAKQELADEMGAKYGMIAGAADTLESDPIVSTALGCIAADLLKTNYKRLTADAPAQ